MAQMAATIQKDVLIVGSTVTVGKVIISICVAILLSVIFGFMNDLSFMMLLSFISINLPGLTKTLQQAFLGVIFADLLQISLWAPSIFQQDDSDLSFNDQFNFNGWTTTRVIPNIGSAYAYLMIILLLMTLQAFLWLFCNCTCPQRYEKWLRTRLYWNGILRLIIQQYVPLLLASLINSTEVIVLSLNMQLKFDSDKNILNSFTAITILCGLVASLLRMIFALLNHSASPTFKNYHGTLVEGLSGIGFFGVYWTMLIIVRWTIYCFIFVFLADLYQAQIMICLILSVITQCLIIHGRPYSYYNKNRISLFNEVMTSVYIYLLLPFTEYYGSNQCKDQLSWGLIIVIGVTLVVNLAVLVVEGCKKYHMILRIIRRCKMIARWYNNSRAKIYAENHKPQQLQIASKVFPENDKTVFISQLPVINENENEQQEEEEEEEEEQEEKDDGRNVFGSSNNDDELIVEDIEANNQSFGTHQFHHYHFSNLKHLDQSEIQKMIKDANELIQDPRFSYQLKLDHQYLIEQLEILKKMRNYSTTESSSLPLSEVKKLSKKKKAIGRIMKKQMKKKKKEEDKYSLFSFDQSK